jgi:RHS repeat-associated protein
VDRVRSFLEGGITRTFGYDAFGNRWLDTNTGMSDADSHEPQANVFNSATNRMNTEGYDAAGNQTTYLAENLVYDAENRLTSMTGPVTGTASYGYDGEGRRVTKTWTPPGGGLSQSTFYVYDTAGNLAAEYGTEPNPATGTAYLFSDMLGSVRAITDAAGTVTECYDYLPFGRMLSSDDNDRGGCHPGSPDAEIDSDVSQKFTGQVRDEETRLDYFKARYFSSGEGRFLSPDIAFVDQDPQRPQSWNLYLYTRNNPTTFVDPTGLCIAAVEATDETAPDDICQDPEGLRITGEGEEFIREEEGYRNDVYFDLVSRLTVGIGHLVLDSDELRFADVITDERIEMLFAQDLSMTELDVRRLVNGLPLSQNEFNALGDLVFNLGLTNLNEQNSPGLNMAIRARDYEAISNNLLYSRATNPVTGEKARVPVLFERSESRRLMFLGQYPGP